MMAENPARRNDEIAALREGVELGMILIDTAEMYGEGEAEILVGEAIAGLRDKVFLVSKAYPHHASARLLRQSCEASLKRLGTDHLDLYLLPWLAERSMPVMAYSPVEQGRLLSHKALAEVARRHEASPARIALAWLLSRPGILPIPKAGAVRHVQDNRAAADLTLSDEDIAQLERSFPCPTARRGLEML